MASLIDLMINSENWFQTDLFQVFFKMIQSSLNKYNTESHLDVGKRLHIPSNFNKTYYNAVTWKNEIDV